MTTLEWTACSAGCACANHSIPIHAPFTIPPAPAYTHLTSTNDVPHPGEEAVLRGFIATLQDRIQDTEATIRRLLSFRRDAMSQVSHIDAQLGALQADLTRIAGAVVQARAPLGAIRRLPPEILSRIFAETIIFPTRMTPNFDENHLADIQPNKSWHIHERESPLWSIELVCKQWRREVLASHALWTRINIIIRNKNFPEGNHRYLRRIGIQLTRSGQHPLSLCISTHHETSPFIVFPPYLAPLLMGHVSRVRTLELYLRPSMLADLQLLKFWALEKLVVLNARSEVFNGPPAPTFVDAPKLRHVVFVGYERPDKVLSLPWLRIRHFATNHLPHTISAPEIANPHGRSISVGRQLSVLSKMPNLLEWCVRTQYPTTASIRKFQKTPIACTMMLHLSITSGLQRQSKTAIPQLVECINTPVLSTLDIDCAGITNDTRDDPATFQAVCSFIERSACPLTSLSFNNGVVTSALVNLLPALPTLVELRLTDISEKNEVLTSFIKALSNLETGHAVVPLLSTLHLSGELTFQSNEFAEMVESRWMDNGVMRLRDIELEWFNDIDPLVKVTVDSQLHQCCETGLRLRTAMRASRVGGP